MKQPHKTTKKLLNNIKQERIEKIKRATEPIDAIPIIKFLMENKDKFSPEERNKMVEALEEGFEKAGILLIERAIMEGDITEEEYKEYLSKGIKPFDLSPVLQAYYHVKDDKCNKCKDKAIIITNKDTPLYINRKELKQKFGVIIQTPKDAIKLLKKEMSPEALNKIEKLEKALFEKLKAKKNGTR